jgi:hypothetical protein
MRRTALGAARGFKPRWGAALSEDNVEHERFRCECYYRAEMSIYDVYLTFLPPSELPFDRDIVTSVCKLTRM